MNLRIKIRNILVLIVVQVMALACGWSAATVNVPSPTAPSTPTRTVEPTRTPTPAIPVTGSQDNPLKLEALNTIPPEDVVREMNFFGGGLNPPNCLDAPEDNQVVNLSQPDVVVFNTCWYDADTSVRLTVNSPDRGEEVFDLPVKTVETISYLDGYYQVDLTRRAGIYRFRLEGSTRSFNFQANFAPPVLPAFYKVFEAGEAYRNALFGPRHRLHLAGFAPREEVRLLVYRYIDYQDVLAGWQNLTVGKDGQLWLETDFGDMPDEQLDLIVLGPVSGEVHLKYHNKLFYSLEEFQASCPGAPRSRLHSEQYARVNSGVQAQVFEDLSFTSLKGELTAGSQVQVHEGPFCRDGNLWWYFSTENDGLYGYAMETLGSQYVLEPLHGQN